MTRRRCAHTAKIRFDTFDEAAHAALRSSQIRGVALRAYECPSCSGWHLTKNPGNPRVATVPGPFTPADLARVVARRES